MELSTILLIRYLKTGEMFGLYLKLMKKLFIPLLIFLSLLIPISAAAQDEVEIASLEIDFWPEYDSPDMLVIYRIDLSTVVTLPVELNIRIPAVAGEPNAVAVRDSSGSLLNAPYERTVQGDWAYISLTSTLPGLQIEYYDPQLNISGNNRTYEFSWQTSYQVEELVLQVQQPWDASDLIVSPGDENISQSTDGLIYHTIDLGSKPAGTTSQFSISYVKDSDVLSIEGFQVQPSAPISDSTSGRSNAQDFLPWGLGLLGVFLVVGGLWWYWRLSQEQPRSNRRKRGRKPSRTRVTSSKKASNPEEAIYCHQCGKRATKGDRFCRSCGTKLKLKE
jgi:hypothetical protein